MPPLLTAAVVVLCLAHASFAALVRPSITPDPAIGFLVHRSVQHGAAWNHLTTPRADDISADQSRFLAAWSPGQYVVPGLLIDRGLTIGMAVGLVGIVASLAGLAGWLLLFRLLGVRWHTAVLACLLISASRIFGLSFVVYPGGDLLSFAAFPYLAAAVVAVGDSRLAALVNPAVVVAGFYMRNSLAIYLIAWMVAGAIGRAWQVRPNRRTLVAWAGTALGIGLALLAIQTTYVSKGWTLVEYSPQWHVGADALAPFAMPWLTATAFDDVLSWVFTHPDRTVFNYRSSPGVIVPVVLAGAALAVRELRSPDRHVSAVQCLAFVYVVAAVLAVFVITGSGMSLGPARHYLLPGWVLLPLVLEWFRTVTQPLIRAVLWVVLIVPCAYGLAAATANWQRHQRNPTGLVSAEQLTYPQLTARLIQVFHVLDREVPAGTSLIAVPLPDYALEFSRVRVLPANVVSASVADVTRTQYRGTVDNLIIVTERRGMSDEVAAAWLSSFQAYDPAKWELLEIDGHRFHTPVGQFIDRAWLQSRLP